MFKTSKGTELPIINLKGKPYMQVQWRLVWFREEHPDYCIETRIVDYSDEFSIVRAEIRDNNGKLLATATKKETAQGFSDHLEKAETGAIGRALGHVGYGTQFAVELDEGERIVDSPITTTTIRYQAPEPIPPSRKATTPEAAAGLFGHTDYDWIIPGGKHKDRRLGDLPVKQRAAMADFFCKGGAPKGWCADFVEKHRALLGYEAFMGDAAGSGQ